MDVDHRYAYRHAVGAGGGSIARIDKAGLLQVGVESAGSSPGPICYGRGVTGPDGLFGGEPGGTLEIEISQDGHKVRPPHVSKGEGYALGVGDWIQIRTPGGGGYGPASERSTEAIARDRARGYYGAEA